jgi:hypothetical protein
LEKVSIDEGFDETADEHALVDGPLADYGVEGVQDEGLSTGLAGVIGYLLGFGATKAALALFSESHPGMVPFSLELAGGAVVTALFVGLVSSAYPAFMAARMDPNEALRAL